MVRKTIGFRKLAILPCSVQSQVDRVSQLCSSKLVNLLKVLLIMLKYPSYISLYVSHNARHLTLYRLDDDRPPSIARCRNNLVGVITHMNLS